LLFPQRSRVQNVIHFTHEDYPEGEIMLKRVAYICTTVLFLLAACTPAATPAPAEAPAQPSQVPAAQNTAAPSSPSAESYKVPEGALAPVPLKEGSQFSGALAFKAGSKAKIAYMPPTTNPYYNAIGEGVKAQGATLGVEIVVLSATNDADVAGQMKMLQDVATQGVDGIILSTHDENAAGPLVKQLTDKGIPVVIINSDIAAFPSPVTAVVGYAQRKATTALGEYIAKKFNGKATVGVLEGQAGYHSTERVGGFEDAFKKYPDMKVVASLPTSWNQETGNKATMDMLQAHPEINLIVAANDFIAIGAAGAVKSLGRTDVEIYGNDGDTTGMEQIFAGEWQGTSNTVPFVMGKIALQVTMDALNGKFPGGFVETPAIITTKDNAAQFLCHPENLFPKPAKPYTCP
jgi:ribose transport system substrate-binding protein